MSSRRITITLYISVYSRVETDCPREAGPIPEAGVFLVAGEEPACLLLFHTIIIDQKFVWS